MIAVEIQNEIGSSRIIRKYCEFLVAFSNSWKLLLKKTGKNSENITLMGLYSSIIGIGFAPFSCELVKSSCFHCFHSHLTQQLLVTSSEPFQNIQQIQSQAIIWHHSGVTKYALIIVPRVDDLSPTAHINHSLFTKPQFWQIFTLFQKKDEQVNWNENCFVRLFLLLEIWLVKKTG